MHGITYLDFQKHVLSGKLRLQELEAQYASPDSRGSPPYWYLALARREARFRELELLVVRVDDGIDFLKHVLTKLPRKLRVKLSQQLDRMFNYDNNNSYKHLSENYLKMIRLRVLYEPLPLVWSRASTTVYIKALFGSCIQNSTAMCRIIDDGLKEHSAHTERNNQWLPNSFQPPNSFRKLVGMAVVRNLHEFDTALSDGQRLVRSILFRRDRQMNPRRWIMDAEIQTVVSGLTAQRTIRKRLKDICTIYEKRLRRAKLVFPENLSPAQHELRNLIHPLGIMRREVSRALQSYIPLVADRLQRIEDGPGLDLQVEQAKASLELYQHKQEMVFRLVKPKKFYRAFRKVPIGVIPLPALP